MNVTPEDYFTLQQLADYLRRSKRTVQRLIQLGQGPPVIQLGRRPLFAKSSVIEWLRSKEHLPQSEREDPPRLDVVGALRDAEAHGENSAACRLLVSEQGQPLSPKAVEEYLRRLLAAGIERLSLPLA